MTDVLETNVETSLEEQPLVKPVDEQPTEFVYEYQPLDDLGRPLGAKQVFKGTSAQEVLDKVANAHKESIKLNRELKKSIRLGDIRQDEIPENAARMEETDLDIVPKPLTPEERVQLSRDLLDPERFEQASARLVEAQIGRPEAIRNVLSKANQDISALRAKEEAQLFVQANPDYYVCKENYETIVNWMLKNKLAPIRANYQLAYDRLKEVGLLLEAPIMREEPRQVAAVTPENSHPAQEDTSRITSTEPSQTKRAPKQVASGFNRADTSDIGTPSQSGKLSVEEIERMSADQYKQKLLKDPNFAKEVERAYASARQ